MRTIHKFPVSIGITTINAPSFTVPMLFAEQSGSLFIWLQVDTELSERQDYTVRVIGTGQELPEDMHPIADHVDSLVTKSGSVWHCFFK